VGAVVKGAYTFPKCEVLSKKEPQLGILVAFLMQIACEKWLTFAALLTFDTAVVATCSLLGGGVRLSQGDSLTSIACSCCLT